MQAALELKSQKAGLPLREMLSYTNESRTLQIPQSCRVSPPLGAYIMYYPEYICLTSKFTQEDIDVVINLFVREKTKFRLSAIITTPKELRICLNWANKNADLLLASL